MSAASATRPLLCTFSWVQKTESTCKPKLKHAAKSQLGPSSEAAAGESSAWRPQQAKLCWNKHNMLSLHLAKAQVQLWPECRGHRHPHQASRRLPRLLELRLPSILPAFGLCPPNLSLNPLVFLFLLSFGSRYWAKALGVHCSLPSPFEYGSHGVSLFFE